MKPRASGRRRLLLRLVVLLAGTEALAACAPGDVTRSGVTYENRIQSLRKGQGGRGGGGR